MDLPCLPFEEEWRALRAALGREDLLEDPRFAPRESRQANEEALARELEQIFIGEKALEWEQHLTAADIACVQVEERSPYHFFAEDLHVRENGFTTEVKSSRWSSFWRYSPLIRFSHTEGKVALVP